MSSIALDTFWGGGGWGGGGGGAHFFTGMNMFVNGLMQFVNWVNSWLERCITRLCKLKVSYTGLGGSWLYDIGCLFALCSCQDIYTHASAHSPSAFSSSKGKHVFLCVHTQWTTLFVCETNLKIELAGIDQLRQSDGCIV